MISWGGRARLLFASILVCLALPASSGETRQYTFDALGRLIEVDVSGGPADGVARDYAYDDAGNRTKVAGSGGTGAAASQCELQTHDLTVSDGFSARVKVEPVSPCAFHVPLTATVTQLSGHGSWSQETFVSNRTLAAGQTYKIFEIEPVAGSVPTGTPLVLRVSFTTTASDAAFLIAHSTVTITSSQ